MTADHVLLALALVANLWLSVRCYARVRRLSAQMAVLTLRMTDLVEALDKDLRGLATYLRTERDR